MPISDGGCAVRPLSGAGRGADIFRVRARLTLCVLTVLAALLALAPLSSASTGRRALPAQIHLGPGVNTTFTTQSLAGVYYPWRSLGYTITFLGQPRPQRAITDNTARTITVYLRPGQTAALTAKIVAYEIGHVVDFWCNTLSTRRAWLHHRHAPAHAHWWAPDTRPEWAYGSGDFADVFSSWATGSDLGYVSTIASPPDPTQLTQLAHAFTCTPRADPDYRAP